MTALLLAGVAVLGAGTLLSLPPTQAAGAALMAAAGGWALADGGTVGADFASGFAPRLGLDGLSAFFLVLVCATAVPALIAARRGPRAITILTGGFVLTLVGVVAARDVTTFLACWELMTLLPAAAILVARRDAEVRRTVFVYLAVTHIGGAGVWIAMLVLAQQGAIGGPPAGPEALVAVAALVGFGTKAGLIPLHAWLPRAHPVAPAHLSALMSAVMLKVALYGLIRVLFEWTTPARWVAIALLALGVVSALGGGLYCLLQGELKRLLAFSSIENVGIVAAGLGASLLLDGPWSALAFGAALLHAANHAAFKALLFLGAGAFSDAIGRLDLDRLGGLLRRMPWTGVPFLAGCAAIAGIPPLNGFASEWLTLRALLALASDGATGLSLAGALAAAGIAVTAGLALMAFVKVAGLVLLGAPRSRAAAQAAEPAVGVRVALAALAGACAVLALCAGPVLGVLAALHPTGGPGSIGLMPELPGTGALAPVGVAIALVALTALLARLAGSAPRTAPAPAWACGQPGDPGLSWTAAGFTKTLHLALEPALRPDREVAVRRRGPVVVEVTHRAEVPHHPDTLLYRPALRWSLRAAAAARRLQSGSLRLYLSYLLGLVLVLLGLVRLGLLA
jgi:formate hydrogenlyase subunit 3/multisubunit Na+/H+ antiporter MnhD subunit